MRRILVPVLLCLVSACSTAISETSAAAQYTIVLSQTANADVGCVDASPNPIVVKSGQPFDFQNNTTIDLTIYNVTGNAPLITVGAGQASATLVLTLPVTSLQFYSGRSGAQNLPCNTVHLITITSS